MSFDVAIFDMQATGITTRADFTQWYEKFTDWTAGRDYDTAEGSTEPIAGFFEAISQTYPSMNSTLADEDDSFFDDPKVTDYSVGIDGIYAAVSYSQAEEFLAEVMKLAPQFEVGLCLNGDPEALATPDGNLIKQ